MHNVVTANRESKRLVEARAYLRAVGGAEVVQVAREVPLRAHAVAGRRQPQHGDAIVRDIRDLLPQYLRARGALSDFAAAANGAGPRQPS